MNKSDYNGVYEELVELLGLENTLKIHKHFRGQQVNFPMRLYSKDYIEEYLIKNYIFIYSYYLLLVITS